MVMNMFSKGFLEYAEEKFNRRLKLLSERAIEIKKGLETCSLEETALLKFYYGTMPLCDAFRYDFQLLKSYASHGIYVRRNMPWCAELKEDMFVQYVAYYRINSEDIVDCRNLFLHELSTLTQGLTAAEAVLVVNDWCASHASYASTDERTQSPLSVYLSGSGRCGEESTFLVTALRSIGIAARQVYAPKWAHCDDNHAWAEVYTGRDWHFIGACEPEEVLDKGWFQGAATRALLVYARVFSDYMPKMQEELAGSEGSIFYVNVTDRYAECRQVRLQIRDGANRPAAGAKISLEILNMAELSPVITLMADGEGMAEIRLGRGDMVVRAVKDEYVAEVLLRADQEELTLTLNKRQEELAADVWESVEIVAPAGGKSVGASYDEGQKQANRKRLMETGRLREKWIACFRGEETEALFQEEAGWLREAGGNLKSIRQFLYKGREDGNHRRAMLRVLAPKDYRDVRAEVLEEHLTCALEVKNRIRLGKDSSGMVLFGRLDEDTFEKYILSPRIRYEELTCYRRDIMDFFDESQKSAFRIEPELIWRYIEAEISYKEEEDYSALTACPSGSLAGKWAGDTGRRVLFVAIARTLGIPARIDPVTLEAQYLENGEFVFVSHKEQSVGQSSLYLITEEGQQWSYKQTWTIARFKEGRFVTLHYEDFASIGKKLALPPGIYRLITTVRIPNGSQYATIRTFILGAGEEKEIKLPARTIEAENMLVDYRMPEFMLRDSEKRGVEAKALLTGKKNFLLFLEEGREPTEHVLNEMLEKKEQFLKAVGEEAFQIVFIAASKEALFNPTLQKVLREMQDIHVYYDEGLGNAEPMARRMYTDPDKLPLLVVTGTEYNGIYISSGYNVGSVDMALRLWRHRL